MNDYRSHVTFDRAFTVRQCQRIVALGDALDVDTASLSGVEVPDDGLRRSRVAWIDQTPDTAWIYDKLAALVVQANRTYRFDLDGFGEDLQYTVYDEPGAFYTWHQDGLVGDVATRKLALVVQLSPATAYEGADLELFDVVADSAPEELAAWHGRVRVQGSVTAFPAFEYHRVTPLRAGVRRSLVVWVSGPPFR
ncbi:2OG-Fe(II) oxygenase [Actinomarinicola tropica]|uniref:2OG-Fe(II) oxygenase n=1 Tax=Actinomarinicola tropica TaxID=2789776 RepID=A0A5Q2RQ97_9ACTN|nr:2OG-Fe(II) oxygenase [Actinomarinicola tropica]QGG96070.1 2OG-Fe(II) oxygenase [Actinomarinicola tropica]